MLGPIGEHLVPGPYFLPLSVWQPRSCSFPASIPYRCRHCNLTLLYLWALQAHRRGWRPDRGRRGIMGVNEGLLYLYVHIHLFVTFIFFCIVERLTTGWSTHLSVFTTHPTAALWVFCSCFVHENQNSCRGMCKSFSFDFFFISDAALCFGACS